MNWRDIVIKEKQQLIQDLCGLLAIPSIKDLQTKAESLPMGEKVGEALRYMLSKADSDGFRTRNIDGYAGYAEMGPEDAAEYIAILCHVDVVPATGDWSSDPFTPSIRNGKLYARGAIDDKGPTMAAYYAMKMVKDSGKPLKHRVRIIFGTDEESGMSCMKKYIQAEPAALTGFAPDAQFPIVHAEKGQINIKLKGGGTGAPTGPYTLLTFHSGEKGNMVPDYAEALVNGEDISFLKETYKVYCEMYGLTYETATVPEGVLMRLRGVSAHGMEPENGVNAGIKLAEFLKPFITASPYLNFIYDYLLGDPNGHKLNIAFADDKSGSLTVNPGIFRFSLHESVIELNIRCPVDTPYLRTIEKVAETAGKYDFDLAEIREKKPHYVDREHKAIQILQHAYESETGLEAVLLSSGGATYAQFIDNGVAYGLAFPGKQYTAHQVDEFVEVDDLLAATAIYARAICGLANM
mgnify:FL=1